MFSSGDFSLFSRAKRENIEIVKWIGKFSLLLKRLKDAWMDMLPTSSMSESRRQNQYHADVAEEDEEKRSRSQELLNLDSPETREEWNTRQVAADERPFPCSDNLTTLMFIVASDLSEAQRERLTSSLSHQEVDLAADTFEAVRTIFVELFCTPKSSRNNPSLRVKRYGGSTSRA